MYAASVWFPYLQQNFHAVVQVQRRFFKRLAEMANMTQKQRLFALGVLTLDNSRVVTDMILIYRCIHTKTDFKFFESRIELSANNECS